MKEREKKNSLYIKQTKNQEQIFIPAFIRVKKNQTVKQYIYILHHLSPHIQTYL